ncbi:MAG: 2-oxoglutarate dehydrogenase E1 component, partial [Bdellovibrionota bacterium]
FHEVLPDPGASASATRVILCTGKIYYELLAERQKQGREKEVALVRVEQLYPWAAEAILSTLSGYTTAKEFVWVQEEPRNMGAWTHVFSTWSGGLDQFGMKLGNRPITYIGREVGAAPAVGSSKIHEREQTEILKKAISP